MRQLARVVRGTALVAAALVGSACASTTTETRVQESEAATAAFCQTVGQLDAFSGDPAEVRANATQIAAVLNGLVAMRSTDLPDDAWLAASSLQRFAEHLASGEESYVEANSDTWVADHQALAAATRQACGDVPQLLAATPVAPTTTAPPVTIAAWPDLPLETVCVDIQGTWDGQPVSGPLVSEAARVPFQLERRSLAASDVGTPCDATVTARFDGTSRSAEYQQTDEDGQVTWQGTLYTGAHITGWLELAAAGREPIHVDTETALEPDDTEITFDGVLPVEPLDAMTDHLGGWFSEGLTKLGIPSP